MKLGESTIPQNFYMQSRTDNFTVPVELVDKTFAVIVTSVSKYLGMVKSKTTKVALKFEDVKGNFILAGIVAYNQNEDAEAQDNWNYYWTFDEADLEEATVYVTTQSQIQSVFFKTAYDMMKARYNNSTGIAHLNNLFATTISNFLEINAKEGEVFTLELDGYFEAASSVENGVIVKSFTPSGEMKTLIKDDAATEVTE